MNGGFIVLIICILYFVGYIIWSLSDLIPNPFVKVKYCVVGDSVYRKMLCGWKYVEHIRLPSCEPANTMFKNGLTIKDVLIYYEL